jgi:hypothetical protein
MSRFRPQIAQLEDRTCPTGFFVDPLTSVSAALGLEGWWTPKEHPGSSGIQGSLPSIALPSLLPRPKRRRQASFGSSLRHRQR